MTRFSGVLAFVLLLSVALRAHAQSIPAAQLTALKAATTLVLVGTPYGDDSGSGFLIKKDDVYGYLVTNAHVVEVEPGRRRRVSVVFYSGIPNQERVLPAEVLGEDDSRDIAILRVRAVDLPEPIKLSSTEPVQETMRVFVLGFPFGEDLATSRLHPAVTITTGSVSSIRLNDLGKVSLVQIDADINPGNSGGPVVDSSGGLVGVATAKIEETRLGFALPPSEIEEMLRGRVRGADFTPTINQNGTVEYTVVVTLIDPLQQVRSVSVFLAPQDQVGKVEPDQQGAYGQASPQMINFPLTIRGQEASGRVVLQSTSRADVPYLHQIRIESANGQIKWTQPARLLVPFARGFRAAPDSGAASSAVTGVPGTSTIPTPGSRPGDVRPGDDWLGTGQPGATSILVTTGAAPVPVTSGRRLLTEPQTVDDATVRYLDLPSGGLVPNVLWSADARNLFILDKGGLHKVSLPDFGEEKTLPLTQEAKYMALSREGLLLGLPKLNQVWLVNPDTLVVSKRLRVPQLNGLAAAPALSTAIMTSEDEMLTIIDLASGQIVAQYRASGFQRPVTGGRFRSEAYSVVHEFKFPTVTPDGKYFLCESGESLHRFRIEGNQLVHEETGPRIGQNSQRIEMSPDGNYVARPLHDLHLQGHRPAKADHGREIRRLSSDSGLR
jgi:S1-C subfamily serine protease